MSNLLNNITQSRQTLPSDATSNAYVSSVDDSKATNTYVNSTFTTESYVDAEVAGIVNSAPATLDTLNELAAALGDDPNFATTVTNSLATKVDETHTGDVSITGDLTTTGQITQRNTDSTNLWTDINSGANPYAPMDHELIIRNDALNTANSAASIFFRAGQTTEGLQVNSARIAAVREAAFNTSLAFSTRATNPGGHTEKMRITSDGKVGIGTSSPSTELDVDGTIQDSQGNVRALERTVINSTPYNFPAASSGKYFACGVNSLTINIDAADIAMGDIFTIWSYPTTGDVTISWTNMTNNVYIAGDTSGKGTSGSITLAAGGLCTVICDTGTRMIFSGNVS